MMKVFNRPFFLLIVIVSVILLLYPLSAETVTSSSDEHGLQIGLSGDMKVVSASLLLGLNGTEGVFGRWLSCPVKSAVSCSQLNSKCENLLTNRDDMRVEYYDYSRYGPFFLLKPDKQCDSHMEP
jgi:hypothetical protein